MYIYKVYNEKLTRAQLKEEIKTKLKPGYIFVYDHRLYIVLDDKNNTTVAYKPLPYNKRIFANKVELEHITNLGELIWYEDDKIFCNDYYLNAVDILKSLAAE